MQALYRYVFHYFDWAKFRTEKGALKLHAVLDYDTALPCYAVMTDGKTHEVNVARDTVFPTGSVLVMDRAYVDNSKCSENPNVVFNDRHPLDSIPQIQSKI